MQASARDDVFADLSKSSGAGSFSVSGSGSDSTMSTPSVRSCLSDGVLWPTSILQSAESSCLSFECCCAVALASSSESTTTMPESQTDWSIARRVSSSTAAVRRDISIALFRSSSSSAHSACEAQREHIARQGKETTSITRRGQVASAHFGSLRHALRRTW